MNEFYSEEDRKRQDRIDELEEKIRKLTEELELIKAYLPPKKTKVYIDTPSPYDLSKVRFK